MHSRLTDLVAQSWLSPGLGRNRTGDHHLAEKTVATMLGRLTLGSWPFVARSTGR